MIVSQRGFTLVEMLVSMAIFAVITAFTTANFSAGRQGEELRLSSQLVASAVRRTQTAAAAGETVAFCDGGTNDLKLCPGGDAECGGGTCVREVPRGYGLHFVSSGVDARRMIFFADTDGDRAYDVGEQIRSDGVSSGQQVSVGTLAPATSGALDIVFEPPKPSTYFNGSVAQAVATVTLRHATTGNQKTVTVNRISGQVSAD